MYTPYIPQIISAYLLLCQTYTSSEPIALVSCSEQCYRIYVPSLEELVMLLFSQQLLHSLYDIQLLQLLFDTRGHTLTLLLTSD
jgi:hypothetical protein